MRFNHFIFCLLAGVFICGGLFLIPSLVLGEGLFIPFNDILDYEIPWRYTLARSGEMFSFGGQVESIMNGLPRQFLGSGLNVPTLLYLFLSPLWSYIINQALVQGAAFVSMFLLLVKILPDERKLWPSFFAALFFGCLPFYSVYGLSVAGLPWLAYACINIVSSARRRDWFLVFIFPFFSVFVLSGIFVLVLLGLVVVHRLLTRRPFLPWLKIIIIFLLGTSIVEHQLLWAFFFSEIPTQRSLWLPGQSMQWIESSVSWGSAFRLTWSYFQNGQYHFPTFAYGIFKASILFSILSFIVPALKQSPILRKVRKLTFLMLVLSLSVSPQSWPILSSVMQRVQFLTTFTPRFYVLIPPIVYVILGLLLAYFWSQKSRARHGAFILLLVQAYWFTWYIRDGSYGPRENLRLIAAQILERSPPAGIFSYRQFISKSLFDDIKRDLGKDLATIRFASLGIYPAVSQLNDLPTLDSYQTMYPLSYHESFRRVIAPEVEKKKELQNYFDHWGSRCYLLSSELGLNFLITKYDTETQKGISYEMNSKAFYEMGGRYILSAVPILNAKDSDLIFLKKYENHESPYRIFAYEVRP